MPADEDLPDDTTGRYASEKAGGSLFRDADGRLSPAFLATLITIPVMILVGFIVAAVLRDDAPTPVDTMGAAAGTEQACAPLMAALPDSLAGYGDKSVSGTKARWRADNGDTVVLRCGVDRPAALAPSSRLQVVDSAQWFITDEREGGVAYVAVDHRPYVALWLPRDSGSAPISQVTALVDKHLARAPLELPNP
ncbi:hypothetical protein GOARA_061_01670 [Gordonia araii NBRC 100433]|uniref:DUF3515 domain-containing protein n=1 Tax=Gordonia araii NBRC 100433 TaxID=1073574 RepID=G7H4F2_9ACTN|nr:DUF3515 domain-containing protein [Gordonia araii]GAB10727.1 hypothetical protein GOARA_061_01670 [Gordonia araii NBRC 100433]